ncbi:MAG: hypothetical protein ABSH28_06780 [Acidobacteriota bacterium]
MPIDNPKEIDELLSFFQRWRGRNLDVVISLFEGFTQREQLRVMEVAPPCGSPTLVRLTNASLHREIDLDLEQFSFAAISPDGKTVEIRRLLGGLAGFRLLASVQE